MESLCRKLVFIVTIFSCAVQLAIAAVNAIDCATNSNNDCVEHSTCVTEDGSSRCQCDSAYKDGNTNPNTCVPKVLDDECDAGNQNADCGAILDAVCIPVSGTNKCACAGKYKESDGQCVEKGLGDLCDKANTNADCAAVSNAVCKDVSGTDKCACDGQYKQSGDQCVSKGLGDSCTAPGDCSAVTGATCTSNACACGGSYKPDTADTTKCKLKGLEDSCDQTTDCSGVPNSECSQTSHKCVCKAEFRPTNGECLKGLGDSCAAASDCSAVTGATCTSNRCACGGSYKPDTDDITKCKLKGLEDSCDQTTDCSGVPDSECSGSPKKCVCKAEFRPTNGQCLKGLGDSCTAPGDCSAVTGATCISNACACGGSYKPDTADTNKCKLKGLNDTCSKDEDCAAVSNTVCVGTPQKCACRTAYEEINGQCSNANGLQTLLSAPVALLLSFLTIVFTRLH